MLEWLLFGFGICYVGVKVVCIFVEYFEMMDEFVKVMEEELKVINEIGEKMV